jgi:hypothetical protein
MGYDLSDYFCSRETEAKFQAAYRALRRRRQLAALLAALTVSALLWSRAPDWLGISALAAAFLVQGGLIFRHLILARASAARN